jgi:general secretion pathway protein D
LSQQHPCICSSGYANNKNNKWGYTVNIKLNIIGLCSVAVLLASCSSIKDAPGYRVSRVSHDASQNYERDRAIKHANFASSTKSSGQYATEAFKPAPQTYSQPVSPQGNKSWESSGKPQQATGDDDVELIIGNHQYYKGVENKKKRRRVKGDGISLSFERASIREVVKVVLGDILQTNYTVEPGVDGEVTINTSQPIPKSDLIPTLESLLQVHGAVLYKDQQSGAYRVANRTAVKGRGFVPETGKKLPIGYGIKIVPLKYIPAAEMQKILQPLANPDAFVRVDTNRNLLVLAGTGSELDNLLKTIDTFDVDVLQGMSVGLYQIHNVEADVVAKNLDALFGESGNSPMAGMVKIMPIEHLNSLMIISASPDYLKDMKDWVDRFDKVRATEGQQLYVYHVQHGQAEHLAEMLTQVFSGKQSTKSKSKSGNKVSSLAPNAKAATVSKDGTEVSATAPAAQKTILGGEGGGMSITPDEDTRIVANKENNSLMIMANAGAYEQITAALKRIDIPPMQVLVEATIMEVSLSENLEYGLQWYFKNTVNRRILGNNVAAGGGGLDLDAAPGLSPKFPGFSYSLTDAAGQIMSVLNMLARDSRLKVISSPSVLVLDNQSAEIRVGDQQPVFSESSSTGGSAENRVVTQSIQYKDTGVSLKVTPRVNANGMVTMDLVQEVTDVGEIDQATGNRSFLQRNIKSNIAVKSGETVILGGLIKDNTTHSKSGLPGAYKLPVVGNLFGGTTKQKSRTELLVLITPTAIQNQKDLYKSGEELRNKMKRLLDGNEIIGRR